MTTTWARPAAALLFALSACAQMRGLAEASRELADRYGEDRVEIDLQRENDRTEVVVRIEDPEYRAGAERSEIARAREVAELIARHVPLDPGDSVAVTFVSEQSAGVLETRRSSSFRFSAEEARGPASPEPSR